MHRITVPQPCNTGRPYPPWRRLVHLQLNRFVQASALGSLPLGLQHLTLNLCEGDSVADCKELPKGLRLETLNITAAGCAAAAARPLAAPRRRQQQQ